MLDFEETLQQQLNAAGVLATQEGLRQFDTDGSPITVGSIQLTSKGQISKDYQTPYGMATVERHVNQSPQGGAGGRLESWWNFCTQEGLRSFRR